MTRPMPTSAATEAKSSVSGVALTYERKLSRSSGAACAALRTRLFFQRADRGGEPVAALFRRVEHIERCAPRREQHDVAGGRERARLLDRFGEARGAMSPRRR